MNRNRIPIYELKKEFPIGQVIDCFYARRPDGLLVDDAKLAYSWPEMGEWGDVLNFIDARLKALGGVRGLRVLSGLYGQTPARWQAELKRLAALLAANTQPIPPTPEPKTPMPAIEPTVEDVIRGAYGPINMQDYRVKKALKLVGNHHELETAVQRMLRMDFMEALTESRYPPRGLVPLAGIPAEWADVCSFCFDDLPERWCKEGAYVAVSVSDSDYSFQKSEYSGVFCSRCVEKTFKIWAEAQEMIIQYLGACCYARE